MRFFIIAVMLSAFAIFYVGFSIGTFTKGEKMQANLKYSPQDKVVVALESKGTVTQVKIAENKKTYYHVNAENPQLCGWFEDKALKADTDPKPDK